MEVKLLEIRDEGTFIPIIAVNMNPTSIEMRGQSPALFIDLEKQNIADVIEADKAQRYLLRRCGYACDGHPNIAISRLDACGYPFWNDPYGWGPRYGARTYPVAHNYIIEHWLDLKDGDVVDVQFILGETKAPKVSERVSVPL
jgi:hypothetical protein